MTEVETFTLSRTVALTEKEPVAVGWHVTSVPLVDGHPGGSPDHANENPPDPPLAFRWRVTH